MTMTTCRIARANGRRVVPAVVAALLLAGALLASAPVTARAGGSPALEAVFGTVLEVSAGEPESIIWLATDDGVVVLKIDAGTALNTGADEVSPSDVGEGDRIVATAERDGDGALIGARVLVQPQDAGPAYRHVVGVVVESGDGRATMLDRGGNTVTADWPAGLEVPAVGEMITVVVRVDARTSRLAANSVERAEETVKRLEGAFVRAVGLAKKQELRGLIEENVARHLAALNETLEGAGAGPGERIVAALDAFGDRYAETARNTGARVPARAETGTIADFSGGVLSVRMGLPGQRGRESRFLVTEETEIRAAVTEDGGVPDLVEHRRVVVIVARTAASWRADAEPVPASRITVYPAELPSAVAAAVVPERPKIFCGSITLVELDPQIPGADGVVIVSDEAAGRKVAAKVTVGTGISVDGRPVGLEYLAAGQRAEVWLAADGVTAEEISARVETRPERHLSGVVRKLDSNVRSIVVEPVRGQAMEVRVSPDAGITRNGRDAGLSEVRADDLVLDASRVDVATGLVARLVVRSPGEVELTGVIAGINEDARQVTVSHRNGRMTTVRVTDETEVRGPQDSAVRLDELSVGDRVVAGRYRPVEEDGTASNVAGYLAMGAPEVASLRGVVSLLDEVHAGAGRIMVDLPGGEGPVKLFVAHPASRVEVLKNGRRMEGLEGVEVGDIVESGVYDPQTGALSKLTVVTSGAERIRGVVASVDTAAGTLAVLSSGGETVEMMAGEDARIHLNGKDVDSLSGIEPGDTVTAALYAAGASERRDVLMLDVLSGRRVLEAVRTAQQGTVAGEAAVAVPAPVETTFSGVIENIEDGKWVMGGRQFLVTERTQFFGEDPERGLVAKAALRAGEDGVFTALAVSVAGRPGENPERRPINVKPGTGDGTGGAVVVTGVVGAIEGHVWVIDGVEFTVTDATRITGVPEEGREARVTLERRDDGAPVALEIVLGEAKKAAGP